VQKDYRDVLEVVKFDLLEETVGSWLRAIIRRLEEEQRAIRRDQQKQPAPSHETLRRTLLYQRLHPESAKPACSTALDRRRQVLSISGRSSFSKLV
jgi:hypothetical protein